MQLELVPEQSGSKKRNSGSVLRVTRRPRRGSAAVKAEDRALKEQAIIAAHRLRWQRKREREAMELAEAILVMQNGDYVVRMKGEEMMADGVQAGDLVVVRPRVELNDKDIFAVKVQGLPDTLLRRVFRNEKGLLVLHSSELDVEELRVLLKRVQVLGVCVGLVRIML